jgi:alpha-amylase/alpha-mannosidase (GH57 family)
MVILNKDEIKTILSDLTKSAEITFHPDTMNTFAAYQVFIGKWEIWLNARNGDVFSAGKTINRL